MQPSLMSVGPVRVCCPFDPAIDRDRTPIAKYTYERDPAMIVERDGAQVTWFHLRRLTRKRILEIDQIATSEKVALITAFRDAVVRVDHLPMPGGDVNPCWQPAYMLRDPAEVTRRQVSDDELELFTREEVYDIGHTAWVLSNLRQGRPVYCPPLDTSVHAMAALGYHRVDASQAGASPASESASTEPTATAPTPD